MKISSCGLLISSYVPLLTLKVNAFSFSGHNTKINDMNSLLLNHASTYRRSQLFESQSVCSIPEDVSLADLSSQRGSAKILRTAVVTNTSGDYVPLDRPMGKGTSVVVFLRHMG